MAREIKRKSGVGGKMAPHWADPNTSAKPPQERKQPGPAPNNETATKTILARGQPGPAGILFLLGRFSTTPPRLSYTLSYRIAGYPIRYADLAACHCERNATHIPTSHAAPATSDDATAISVTYIISLSPALTLRRWALHYLVFQPGRSTPRGGWPPDGAPGGWKYPIRVYPNPSCPIFPGWHRPYKFGMCPILSYYRPEGGEPH